MGVKVTHICRHQISLPSKTHATFQGEAPNQTVSYPNKSSERDTELSVKDPAFKPVVCRHSEVWQTSFLSQITFRKGGDESHWERKPWGKNQRGCERGRINRLCGATLSHCHPSRGHRQQQPSLNRLALSECLPFALS